ncbi:hypothetical protein Bbelb_241840 [Branchiostoma belcheri]|nr:hypothetical protein Bbelb_241840 [Branchiostoma belcheri]
MYEQAAPVRTPQTVSGREQNNRPWAPYPDPPARRGNTSGHGDPGEQYQEGQDSFSNVYEKAESVKLKNTSGELNFGTDTSTDTDTTQPDAARSRYVCHIAAGLAVLGTLVTVVVILLMFINNGTYHREKVFRAIV